NLRITSGMRTHRHTNDTQRAIGYVRVSTREQATDGVSLDAQRDRLRAYCKINSIKLIDIKADEGYSGSNLDRPSLQAALHTRMRLIAGGGMGWCMLSDLVVQLRRCVAGRRDGFPALL